MEWWRHTHRAGIKQQVVETLIDNDIKEFHNLTVLFSFLFEKVSRCYNAK